MWVGNQEGLSISREENRETAPDLRARRTQSGGKWSLTRFPERSD